ncbi:MAG: hypothetical protein WBO10_03860 [Pyrinomonadaceae bacterium]
MTTQKLQVEMKVDTHDVTIIRTHPHQFSVFCKGCQKDVSIFTLEQISAWLKLIKSGQGNLIEEGHGSVICGN